MTRTALPRIELDPDIDPWERQPGETPYRYDQFCAYQRLLRGRTLRKVAETLTRSPAYVRAVSVAYRWVDRVEAWDRHRDDIDDKTWREERRKAAENDGKLLSAALAKLAARLQTLRPEDLSPSDLVRMLDVTLRQRRALYGDPSMVVAVTGPGGDPLTVQLSELSGMTADQRRRAVLALTEDVRRRAEAVAGHSDDDG